MERIVLGSGKLYVDEFTGELPEDAAIEVEAKLLGYIQGGATLSYKPTFYEAKDDLNFVSKKIITDEEAILKSGVMTWNGETLKKLTPTARVTEDTAKRLSMEPYYMYRQKNMAGNFENVGYSVEGLECIYNILIMEEKQTIIACGAGASSKVVFHNESFSQN